MTRIKMMVWSQHLGKKNLSWISSSFMEKIPWEKERHAKFDKLWLGPFQIATMVSLTTFKMRCLIGEGTELFL